MKKKRMRTLIGGDGDVGKLVAFRHGARHLKADRTKPMAEILTTTKLDLWKASRTSSPERVVGLLKLEGRPAAFTAANLDMLTMLDIPTRIEAVRRRF
uniref:Uncharacterized protein n=1 Tax=Peronospora matthiolae TaxID=2874970 RepID=A0AAV1TN56_9STRA